MQQIIVNLLNNSFDSVKNKTDGKIEVNVRTDETDTFVQILDNGSGIPKEEQPFIFERFFRGENKKHTVRGLGLGLPYSLLLAKAQKGNLQLTTSTKGKSIFTFTLLNEK